MKRGVHDLQRDQGCQDSRKSQHGTSMLKLSRKSTQTSQRSRLRKDSQREGTKQDILSPPTLKHAQHNGRLDAKKLLEAGVDAGISCSGATYSKSRRRSENELSKGFIFDGVSNM